MVYQTKKGLLDGGWIMKNKQSFSKQSFLKTEFIDGKVSFEFSVDLDTVKLDEQKTKIEEDFVENLGKEIGKKMKRTKPRNPGYNC